ncbi:helix-turn-helix domain-containing protein [Amycolatopsis keratiniphila]|uniref:HTH cro/C1-type domain-containing protein n=1 Tax=Amycolatopsis keratiniphila subsp. keratiniphila TaxID=227715 RepID=A0A1W2M2S0_9PSEU|nr:helix-turn-helix transcriptional regulator [Amycolatopsis keratiniphila]ONF73954.1 hypothetical protein AVR91_0204285 [Amycolatopsis keratiniphila subsp. keratiniphila]
MQHETNDVGHRVREIRNWREMSLETVAGLAGISYGHLGKIERGETPLNTRNLLESLAYALRVAPSEFNGQPWERAADPLGAAAHAGLVAVENALDTYELGEDPGGPVREWPEICADVAEMRNAGALHSDYALQGELAPKLLAELHALYVRQPSLRTEVLLALIHCYASAVWVTKRLGGRGLSMLAAKEAQKCAEELDSPQWRGYTTWLRGDATGALSRPQQHQRAVRMADELRPHLDHPEVIQAYGMLHLSAALASAVQADKDNARTHLDEAEDVARRLDTEVGTFGRLWFGTTNVGVWRTTIGLELGEGQRVAEQARLVHIDTIPSQSRRAEFFADLGRVLLAERKTQEEGLEKLLQAEKLAPQRIHADVFVREAVADRLRAAQRDAGGRELRGLAWRLGIAPAGVASSE